MHIRYSALNKESIALALLASICLSYISAIPDNKPTRSDIPLDRWKYIEVDNQRGKYGDWGEPEWLKYFGLDMMDATGDNYPDIIAGRYFYRNPGGDMTAKWARTDLGMNVDGMLLVDVDHDAHADVIATALPAVYWFEAQDQQASSWKGLKIGEISATSHVNGQGYGKGQIVPGGNPEILLAAGDGIYYFVIPENDPTKEKWNVVRAVYEASEEGLDLGDMDGDGFIDIVAGVKKGPNSGDAMDIAWWKNPGNEDGNWKHIAFGNTAFDADRIAVADINGDGKKDVVVTEERYPGPDPDASLYWYEQPSGPSQQRWNRHTVVTQYSLNNLDVADMDGDGHKDIITAEHKGPELKLQIWKNDGAGNFTVKVVDRGKESHLGSRVADLNGDGALDIVSIGWDRHQYLHVWRNDGLSSNPSTPERVKWKHLSSAKGDLASPEVGNQSATLVFDIDKDGKDEIVIAGWGQTSMVWYKKKGNLWEKYLLDNTNSHIEAGGVYYDIDGDGDLDILHGGSWNTNEIWWWENPYPDFDPKKPWRKYTIKNTGAKQHHDQVIGDFDGDGKPELVFWNQQASKIFIADIPRNAANKNAWIMKEIWSWKGQLNYEGLTKSDINLDKVEDIVGGGFWFERKGKKYEAHKIDDYGQSRSAAGDLIKGGPPEVVLGSGDGVGPLNIYQWKNEKWEKTVLIDTVIHGHTLQIIDIDGDGNLDIFCAEMALWHDGNNPGSKAWFLYGDGNGNFTKEILNAATNIGNHESKLGDVDGDGRPDIIQKPFMKDVPRLDVWLNQGTRISN